MTWVAFGGSAFLLLALGGLLTEVGPWYRDLRKPVGQPPSWLFAPAWTIILALAAWSGVLAWDAAGPGLRPAVAAAYAVNAALHALWSPLFFKARRPDWALREIPLLLLSVVALAAVAWAAAGPAAALLLLPYLLWVGYAVYLNREIVRLNGSFAPKP